MRHSIVIDILGCRFGISFGDKRSRDVLTACYAPFVRAGGSDDETAYQYKIDRSQHGWHLLGADLDLYCPKLSDLIYDFEKDLTVRVQLSRPDRFFVHGAVVANDGQAVVIVGESGAGKSTLCWALSCDGFCYMSDELAPLSVDSLKVDPYPRAICLKAIPDDRYPLPAVAIDAGATLHIPPAGLPGGIRQKPAELRAILFIERDGGRENINMLKSVSSGEAAARLYANSLNQLSHERDGLTAVSAVAVATESFRIQRDDIGKMVDLVRPLLT